MEKVVQSAHTVRFANFEVDLDAGELRKNGLKLKFSGQPFEVLAILLEHPGAIVTREQLQKRLWPDSFVDFDHNLNSAINRIREALGDSSENPRFVETLPRRGYRFIGAVEHAPQQTISEPANLESAHKATARFNSLPFWVSLSSALAVLLIAAWLVARGPKRTVPTAQHPLTRLTFDEGLQTEATWSPDAQSIAYSSNRGGKFDIWEQQVSGGNPVQITQGLGNSWQPDWSPDGKYIAYRSEGSEPGIYVIPALGGAGLERKIASFGYHPRWSPDGKQLLFDTDFTFNPNVIDRFYVVDLSGVSPKEVASESSSQRTGDYDQHAISAAWYPDGNQISVRYFKMLPDSGISTISLRGGPPTKLAISPKVAEQLESVSSAIKFWDGRSGSFLWEPSGTALYYEEHFRGAQNIWRMNIEPRTSTAFAVQRLTTGAYDSNPSLSRDGKKLAFTAESVHIRSWLFPFDATRGRITGTGRPITSSGTRVWRNDLSRNGKTLGFTCNIGETHQLCAKSMPNGQEAPITPADSYVRTVPTVSSDGTKLAYVRRTADGAGQLTILRLQSHSEETVTAPTKTFFFPYDWSPRDDSLLVSRVSPETGRAEVWQIPARANGEDSARKLISDPAYDFYQPHFSWDGRWIAFEGVKTSGSATSTLYVMRAVGGHWIPIAESKTWDDKPRWSPDGKTLYFVSRRTGAFEVWGIRFDNEKGEPIGKPFELSSFGNGLPKIPDTIQDVDISVTQDKLVVNMEDRTGNIWMLDNVDRE